MKANDFLSSRLKDNEIDFHTYHTPHVTLYLTEWRCDDPPPGSECKEPLVDAMASAIRALEASKPCVITVGSPYAAGNYAMLNVSLTSCLQLASDTLVNGTYRLAVANQSVPSWVRDLPVPERSEKAADVREYGSPNVFGQFQPHVSVGWSPDASAVAEAVGALRLGQTTFEGSVVALGTTGPHGTVLKGKDLASFNLTASSDPKL